MIERKTKSTVLITSGVIGTSGVPGYLHSISINSNGAGVGVVTLYDGTDTTGTLKFAITVTATAGDGRSIAGMNIYFPNGIYALLVNTVLCSFEYSGC